MGYCYDTRGRLCCDRCDEAGGVRRKPCKYGYCQPVAYCPACRADKDEQARHRAHCEENCREAAARFAREHEQETLPV